MLKYLTEIKHLIIVLILLSTSSAAQITIDKKCQNLNGETQTLVDSSDFINSAIFNKYKKIILSRPNALNLAKKYSIGLEEMVAILIYTKNSRIFNSPNWQEHIGKYEQMTLDLREQIFALITTGLKKLPDFKGRVYRGLRPSRRNIKFVSNLSENKIVTVGEFWSTSTIETRARAFGDRAILVLDVLRGKNIQEFSINPEESEIIILPGAEFSITKIKSSHDGMSDRSVVNLRAQD